MTYVCAIIQRSIFEQLRKHNIATNTRSVEPSKRRLIRWHDLFDTLQSTIARTHYQAPLAVYIESITQGNKAMRLTLLPIIAAVELITLNLFI